MAAALAGAPNFASGGGTIMLCEREDFLPVTDGTPVSSTER